MVALLQRHNEAATLLERGVAETVHTFGDGLVGILSRPRSGASPGTALILFNAGLVQRAGPFRVYAQLARALCSCGFTVLRFDQSGRGDSPLPTSTEEKFAEAIAAMDMLAEQTGIDRFVLGGICSGADDALNFGHRDNRVAGLLLLDGVAYRTPGYWIRQLLPRLLSPSRIARRLTRMLSSAPQAPRLDEDDFRNFPTRQEATHRLGELVSRDVRLYFLYTGGANRYLNHLGQARACFGAVMRSTQVTTDYWPDCDHTFYLRRDRLRLNTAVSSWMRMQFSRE